MHEPQEAPWPVGTRLRFIGGKDGSMSGYVDDATGETIYSHKHGVIYRVIDTRPPNGYDWGEDDYGNRVKYPDHGWSVLQSELDPDGKHQKAVTVYDRIDYEIVK